MSSRVFVSAEEVEKFVKENPRVGVRELLSIGALVLRRSIDVERLLMHRFRSGIPVSNFHLLCMSVMVDQMLELTHTDMDTVIALLDDDGMECARDVRRDGYELIEMADEDPAFSFLRDLGSRLVDVSNQVLRHELSPAEITAMFAELMDEVGSYRNRTIIFPECSLIPDVFPPADQPRTGQPTMSLEDVKYHVEGGISEMVLGGVSVRDAPKLEVLLKGYGGIIKNRHQLDDVLILNRFLTYAECFTDNLIGMLDSHRDISDLSFKAQQLRVCGDDMLMLVHKDQMVRPLTGLAEKMIRAADKALNRISTIPTRLRACLVYLILDITDARTKMYLFSAATDAIV